MLHMENFTCMVSEEMEYELNSFFLNGVFRTKWENIILETKSARLKAKHSKLFIQKKYKCSSHNSEDIVLNYTFSTNQNILISLKVAWNQTFPIATNLSVGLV